MNLFRYLAAALALAVIPAFTQGNAPVVHAGFATVTGVIWNDLNANGVRDTSEPGLAGWQQEIVRTSCTIISPIECVRDILATSQTDEDGSFTIALDVNFFSALSVCFIVPSGWTPTSLPDLQSPWLTQACSLSTSLGSFSLSLPISANGTGSTSIGFVQRSAFLSSRVECPPIVSLDEDFNCMAELKNEGDVLFSSVEAFGAWGLCHKGGPCIHKAGPPGGYLEYITASPTWTVQGQYKHPYWQPLGSGSLTPDAGENILVTLSALAVNSPGEHVYFCATVSGFSAFEDYTVPFRTSVSECADIIVVEQKDLALDTDGDTTPNKTDTDDDSDGCPDVQELGWDQVLGGQRDPHNFWDFFDPNRDRSVGLLDFLAVLRHFGTVGDPSTFDPDGPEPPAGEYWALADRGGQDPNGDPWDELPANGSIGLSDFLSVLRQFGHTCA